jgi:hypothetical protein
MKTIPKIRRKPADDRVMNPRKVSSENTTGSIVAVNLRVAKMIKNIRIGEFIRTEV